MTPKEKAKYLVFKFTKLHTNNQSYVHDIYCALIAVDEILISIKLITMDEIIYWQEVKQEINNL